MAAAGQAIEKLLIEVRLPVDVPGNTQRQDRTKRRDREHEEIVLAVAVGIPLPVADTEIENRLLLFSITYVNVHKGVALFDTASIRFATRVPGAEFLNLAAVAALRLGR